MIKRSQKEDKCNFMYSNQENICTLKLILPANFSKLQQLILFVQ